MTPEQKAEELYVKFSIEGMAQIKSILHRGVRKDIAKQCALIAVDEILQSGPSYPYDIQFDAMPHFKSLKYWQEVKHEIEKI